MLFQSFSSLLFFVLATRASVGPVTDLRVVNTVLSPDGVSRETVVVNGQFPGPLIVGNKGDNFRINVHDDLNDTGLDTATSIHWHGLFQHNTQVLDWPCSMDTTYSRLVLQCPIVPGESFLYRFSVPDQAGTYWYHSHYKNQYCDGLRGPLVIYDPRDPNAHLYDVDDESTVITLADWYQYYSTNAPLGPAQPSTALINGKGRMAGGSQTELAIINVDAGKRYRFRLVSISCDTYFKFSIDSHKLAIIEVDGVNHQQLVVDQIEIFAAQRYSFVLAANQPVSNYWIRADGNNIKGSANDADGVSKAILRYNGAPDSFPTSKSTVNLPLNEQDLHPLANAAAPGKPTPGGADVNLVLDISLGSMFAVNGTPFVAPDVPVLLQILSGAPPDKLLPNGTTFSLPPNKNIEISIVDLASAALAGPHPVHLHGHVFSVVKSAGNQTYNFENPPQRDTVSIGGQANDGAVIRFRTDNPGPWFMHCHIDWHLNLGFAAVFVEDQSGIQSPHGNTRQAWDQLCPAYNSYMGITTSSSS
ncbi:laccase [Vararia minispora EC-137]|uniref:Laccase n=1 Tax=Vararia minispora EC-137 TaxID=1314806 RepID=A0ACB8QWY7_9AGAM|nr:laccase [Vararia minispora EC-137]